MQVLILGGTHFIGRHIAESLLAAGHTVTIFNRGQTPDPLPRTIERLRGDRDAGPDGLDALRNRRWDACIDTCGYTARQVRPAVELLRSAIDHYVYTSAVMSYGDVPDGPISEDHPQVAPIDESVTELDNETYGRLKVTCERIVESHFANRCTLLRPQVVVGPNDPTPRYACWLRRAASNAQLAHAEPPDEMLAPGDGSDHLQVIDVRDVAAFARTAIEHSLSGPFNLAGPRITWREFMTLLAAPRVRWVPAEILRAAAVNTDELPLYRGPGWPYRGLMHIDNGRALAAGLTLTPPAATIADARATLGAAHSETALTPKRERTLLSLATSR